MNSTNILFKPTKLYILFSLLPFAIAWILLSLELHSWMISTLSAIFLLSIWYMFQYYTIKLDTLNQIVHLDRWVYLPKSSFSLSSIKEINSSSINDLKLGQKDKLVLDQSTIHAHGNNPVRIWRDLRNTPFIFVHTTTQKTYAIPIFALENKDKLLEYLKPHNPENI